MGNQTDFDVIIVGGSYAGLSAAMALGRSLRNVLVIDSGFPCNRQTPHSHNFLTQDGETPAAIAERAKAQVAKYETVRFIDGLAVAGKKTGDGFSIGLESGEAYSTSKMIFATGVKDLIPDIKGFAECWGISLIHCPYCHGYEFSQRETGILAKGEKAYHLAGLVNNLTGNLTLLTTGEPELAHTQLVKLRKRGIGIIDKAVVEIIHQDGQLQELAFSDGSKKRFDAVYAVIPFKQHTDIPEMLGCELTEHGYLKVNHMQETTVAGVFACGDNTAMMRSVANAVYAGNLTGALVNRALTEERF